MLQFEIPGMGSFQIKHLLLDFNGTIALDGDVIEGVEQKLNSLKGQLQVHIVSADTQGTATQVMECFPAELHIIEIGKGQEAVRKLDLLHELGKRETIVIGNGFNDALALKESAIGICVLGREGASAEALNNASIVVSDIRDGLDLLLRPKRLIASLRR